MPGSSSRSTTPPRSRGGLRLHRGPRLTGRSPRGGAADRGRARLAVDRCRDRGRAARGRRRPTAARADPDRRARARVGPNGSSPDAGRRRRDHPARHRCDPRAGRRGTASTTSPGSPSSRSSSPGAPTIASGRLSSIARSPSCSSPPAPTAPGCGTSWATTDAGSTSRMSATMSAERSGRSVRSSRPPGFRLSPARPSRCSTHSSRRSACDVSLRTAAYTILGLARLDPDRLDHDARVLLERLVDQLATAYRGSAAGSWLWFEDRLAYDNARLSQALIVGGSALRRQPDVALGLESLAWLGDECGLDEGMLRLPGHHGRDRDEPAPGRGRRAAPRRDRVRRGRARRARRDGRRRARVRVRATRSTGSWAEIASTARSTTSRQEAAATVSARPTSTRTRAPSPPWPSIAPSCCSTPLLSRPTDRSKIRAKAA